MTGRDERDSFYQVVKSKDVYNIVEDEEAQIRINYCQAGNGPDCASLYILLLI